MIRTNLSTRPFYNERAVRLWLALIALAVVAATTFNVTSVLRYSRSDTQLAGEASRDETRAADLRRQATKLRATVDPKQIEYASNEARQANALIDRRTFSWTELFNRFETTLPDDVRITMVKPTLDKDRGIVLVINVVARGVQDVEKFIDNLDATKVFTNILTDEDHYDEQGALMVTLEAVYKPERGKAAAR
jgi:Tfp pilus assembly protein PilN